MNIFISNTSGKALYEQIYDQIKILILEGSLKEGEPLPTIRGLAILIQNRMWGVWIF